MTYNILMPAIHTLLSSASTSPAVASGLLRVYTALMTAYYSPTTMQQTSDAEGSANTMPGSRNKKGRQSSTNFNSAAFAVAATDVEELLELLLECLQNHGNTIGAIEVGCWMLCGVFDDVRLTTEGIVSYYVNHVVCVHSNYFRLAQHFLCFFLLTC